MFRYRNTAPNALVSNTVVRANLSDSALQSWAEGGGIWMNGGQVVDSIIVANTNNNTTAPGAGGIHVFRDLAPVIARCEIIGNHSVDAGGGVYVTLPLELRDCRIENNTAGSGGGIYVLRGGNHLTVSGGTIVSNMATGSFGGGVYVDGRSGSTKSDLTLNGVTIAYNVVSGWGGGGVYMHDLSGDLLVDRTVIRHNEGRNPHSSAYGGGGILHRGNFMRVRNSLLVGNRMSNASESNGRGGAIFIHETDQTNRIESSTIVDNFAASDGGGIFMRGNGDDEVWNCIVYGNVSPGGADQFAFGNTARRDDVHYTLTPVAVLDGNHNIVDRSPAFVDGTGGDYRLERGSPGINAGLEMGWMADAHDLAGNPRLDTQFGWVDMGCYEYVFKTGTTLLIR